MAKPLILIFVVGSLLSSLEAKIDPSLKTKLASNEITNVIVNFVGGNAKVVNSIEIQHFVSRTHRINALKSALEENALRSQQPLQSYLTDNSIAYTSFWVSNQMYVPNADFSIIEAVASFPEVEEIHEEIMVPLYNPLYNPTSEEETPIQVQRQEGDIAWGIERIQAVAAWNITSGAGVVVSHIDTGVRHTHEALSHNFRGAEYGWFDPYDGNMTPMDDDGHGTHIMGTIAGTKGIGGAPNATWVACRGCNLTTCTEANLITCGQWVVCPWKPDGTKPDCSKAPALTSCSWGIGQLDSWYERVTEAWVAARIVPIFAHGNSGPNCGTTNSPGDYKRVIAVGSTHMEDRISNFSSVGPTPDNRVKPDISAPGEEILSSLPDSDVAYGIKRGTSMAAPHVATATALLLSVAPNLTFEQVRESLAHGVDTNLISQNASCGGISDNVFPNNHFGHGRVNALKLVQAAIAAN